MQDHTNKAFDIDLDGMRSALMMMGGLVEKQIDRAVRACTRLDLALASQVLADEEIVNSLQMQVDLLCNQIIARRQPIAIDLREVIASIHTVNDLERIGDEAKKIVIKARSLQQLSSIDGLPLDRIEIMGERAVAMMRHALNAFLRQDTKALGMLTKADAEIDALRDELHAELMRIMAQQPSLVATCVDLVFIVQSIERIGDHAKNVAEYIVNVVEGIDMRHSVAPSISIAVAKRELRRFTRNTSWMKADRKPAAFAKNTFNNQFGLMSLYDMLNDG
jgi:phosphate transport system protein